MISVVSRNNKRCSIAAERGVFDQAKCRQKLVAGNRLFRSDDRPILPDGLHGFDQLRESIGTDRVITAPVGLARPISCPDMLSTLTLICD